MYIQSWAFRAFALCAALAFSAPNVSLAQAPDNRPIVIVAKVEAKRVGERGEFVGRVEAEELVELRARVTGFLKKIGFADGAEVAAGDVLFEIEPEPFEASLAQRKAQLAAARATARKTGIDLRRQKRLSDRRATSQAAYDDAAAAAASANAAVDQAAASVREAEIQLSYTKVTSPISGTIGRAVYSEGNLVSPASGVLATVAKSDVAEVYFDISQRRLLEARRTIGDAPLKVHGVLADGSTYPHSGKIDFIDIVVNPQTDGQTVRAVFDNPGKVLVHGQSLRLRIEEANPELALTVPLSALSADQSGSFVLVVNDKDEVERRSVQVGSSRVSFAEIRDGLKAGERVIVQGQLRVREGMKVRTETVPQLGSASVGD